MADENINLALSPGHLLSEERVRRISPSFTNKDINKLQIYNNIVRIATWNIRSLYMSGKLANVELERCRLKIDILGLSEVRWPGSGQQITKTGTIYYSGRDDSKHEYGVAIIVSPQIAKSVLTFIPINERMMLLRLRTSHRIMNIIQVYAPTNQKPEDDEVVKFYNDLHNTLKITKKGELTMIIGDFNSKIGAGEEDDVVGKYGLGVRNLKGDALVEFCNEQQLFVANTFFKLPPRRLYTWKSPADRTGNIVRNQIDFIIIKKELRKYVKAVKTYPGADADSDHNPVVMDFKMNRFLKVKTALTTKRIDIRKVKIPEIREEVKKKLVDKFKMPINNNPNKRENETETEIERTWNFIKYNIVEIQNNTIGTAKNDKKQQWMTDEILDLMNERRKYKTRDISKYKKTNKLIRRKCRDAKEQWMAEKCQEIETLQNKYDTFNLHKKIKEMTQKNRKHQTSTLKNKENKIIVDLQEKIKTWKEYVEQLFDDIRPDVIEQVNVAERDEGPDITKAEVIHAINMQKDGKTTGPDKIHSEIIKVIAEQDDTGLQLLLSLINSIYRSGKIPTDWLKSTFVTIPKKPNPLYCDDYRMISLMSHVLKIFLRIIHSRIYNKCEEQINDTQFGFRKGLGTREAIFCLNVLTQQCRDMNVDIYACFIDYQKAFDCVNHEKLIEILQATRVDYRDIRIIAALYWQQSAEIKVERETSESILIKKGVRQGCILSPLLFNLYSEAIFRESLDENIGGVVINGRRITNLRYADDTVIMATNATELQMMVDRLVENSEEYGLILNISKTKVMDLSKTKNRVALRVKGNIVEQVPNFKYLGTTVNENGDNRKEIRSRIEQARRAFTNMKKFFTRSDLSLSLRLRMIRCYVFPILLYGCECWTLDPNTEKKIEAFEMYIYRRILRIPWTKRITNAEVLQRMNTNKELLLTLKERKIEYFGHVMRGNKYEILRLIIEGKIQGKRSVGRRKNSWLKDIRRWLGCKSIDIFRAAVSKTRLAIWIANLRKETAQ